MQFSLVYNISFQYILSYIVTPFPLLLLLFFLLLFLFCAEGAVYLFKKKKKKTPQPLSFEISCFVCRVGPAFKKAQFEIPCLVCQVGGCCSVKVFLFRLHWARRLSPRLSTGMRHCQISDLFPFPVRLPCQHKICVSLFSY